MARFKTLAEFRTLTNPFADASQISIDFGRDLPQGWKRAIVVSAQNATPAHAEFWQIIRNKAKRDNREIFVVPLRYKNPTSAWTGSQKNAEHWAPEFKEFMWSRRVPLNANITLFADVPTQPTAARPLSSFDAMSGAFSAIYGHTKLESTIVPVPSGRMGKLLTTTGAATLPNYTLTKLGKVGAFHHSLSALLVDMDGNKFYIRQFHYSGTHNSATDGVLGLTYHPNGKCSKAPRPLALGCGDIHVDYIDPAVWTATDELIQRLQPESVVLPDLLDSYAVNPHHVDDPFIGAAKYDSGRDSIRAEALRAIAWTTENAQKYRNTEWVVQSSNHNDMLRRWLAKNFNWRIDHQNSEFGLETALYMRRNAKITERGAEYPDPLHYWFRHSSLPPMRSNIKLLGLDESFAPGGIEHGLHGDIGANGAKGSRKAFAHMGNKSVTFHTHSDYIYEGNYGAGTKTRLRLEYNHGLNGWTNADVLTQWDSKRQIVRYIDGAYKA
jgi:hypothetical protein